MKDVITLQGRELTPGDVEYIRQMLTEDPTWSRRKLSIARIRYKLTGISTFNTT